MKYLIAVFALLFATSAFAADVYDGPAETPFKPAVAYDLGGIYAGVQAGAMAGSYDLSAGPLGIDGFGEVGAFGGGHIGVQGVWGALLLGVEGGAIVDNADHEISFGGVGSISTSEEYLLYIGAKIGAVIGAEQRTAIYIMPGFETFETEVSLPGLSVTERYNCAFGRIGADTMATQSWMIGVFGQYSHCGDQDWGVAGLDVGKESVRAGIQASYKLPMFGN